jgi:hypothetical protein
VTADEPAIRPNPWEPGDTVVLRYLTRTGGVPGSAWVGTLIEDSPERVALYIPAGTPHVRWQGSGDGRRLVEVPWRYDTLRLMFPGAAHSVWLYWRTGGPARAFIGYYVNMEEPFRRTHVGFDTNDHALDIVVAPDLIWRWKDREELDAIESAGGYSAGFAQAVREEGERAAARIEERRTPFDGSLLDWRADDRWPVPAFPAGWRDVPPAKWSGRHWAYGAHVP